MSNLRRLPFAPRANEALAFHPQGCTLCAVQKAQLGFRDDDGEEYQHKTDSQHRGNLLIRDEHAEHYAEYRFRAENDCRAAGIGVLLPKIL